MECNAEERSEREDYTRSSLVEHNSEKQSESDKHTALAKDLFGSSSIDLSLIPSKYFRDYEFKKNYTLSKRMTADELILDCSKKIKIAQDLYKSVVSETIEKYIQNIESCREMDELLGVSQSGENPNSDVDELKILSDGTKQCPCSMHLCNTVSFKIKRHIYSQHNTLSDDQKELAVRMSKVMANNRTECSPAEKPAKKVKRKVFQNTNLVNKKNNYKLCLICGSLCLNMSDHVKNTHKISKENSQYDHYVKNAEIILKCYTKLEGNKVVPLIGEELAAAKEKYGEDVEKQSATLEGLRELRQKMSNCQDILRNSQGEEKEKTRKKLDDLKFEYSTLRYSDSRLYSERVKMWKDSFLTHLEQRGFYNPSRGVNMALEIILPFEANMNTTLKFEDLMDPRKIRSMLQQFKLVESTNFTSKGKYVNMLRELIKFLVYDIYSPERKKNESNEEIIAKGLKIKDVEHEIKCFLESLSKEKGADRIKARYRAKKKIIPNEDLKELLEETRNFLKEVLKDNEDGEIANYDLRKVLKVRDSLIAVAIERIGRRSKEVTTMSLEEVERNTTKEINGVTYHIIEVLDNKLTKTGVAAAIAFSEEEFRVLRIFIEKLRPRLLNGRQCVVVFPNYTNSTNPVLSLSATHKILQKFQTKKGQKLSSRVVRASKITHSRERNISEEEKRSLAISMNHSLQTAERYYNFNELSNSVAKSIELQDSHDETCVNEDRGAEETVTDNAIECQEEFENSMVLPTPSYSSTPLKRKISQLDETLKHLRSKKVKPSNQISNEKVAELKKKIAPAVRNLAEPGKLYTKTGKLNVRVLKSSFPSEFFNGVPLGKLREIVKDAMEEELF